MEKINEFMSNPKVKNILLGAVVVAMVAVFLVWSFLDPPPEHIEDTNGPGDYSLQQITQEDIISQKMGSRGGLTTTETSWNFGGLRVSNGVRYSCKKFTGVHRLYSRWIAKGSDIYIYLADFYVESGNFAFYVVLDGEIIGQVTPDDMGVVDFTIENIEKSGTLEYIIAGESAKFGFLMPSEW